MPRSRTGAQSGGPEGARGGYRRPVPGWTAWATGEATRAGRRAVVVARRERWKTERLSEQAPSACCPTPSLGFMCWAASWAKTEDLLP